MKFIKCVKNKDGSETVYVPAKYTRLFYEIISAGESQLEEAEPESFEDVPQPLFEYFYR